MDALTPYKIEQISPQDAKELCQEIINDMPEYFGITDCNELFLHRVTTCINFAAKKAEKFVGLISVDFPYPGNGNIYWIGVMKSSQMQGIGRSLISKSQEYAKQQAAKSLTVETIAPTESKEINLKTYQFYLKMGFSPLFNIKPMGYEWQIVYMVKNLNDPITNITYLENDAREFGFELPNKEMIIDQALSECLEIKDAISNKESEARVQEEIGDLLHSAISLCIFCGFDLNQTLDNMSKKFGIRMNALKEITKKCGLNNLKGRPIEFLLKVWNEAKIKGNYY